MLLIQRQHLESNIFLILYNHKHLVPQPVIPKQSVIFQHEDDDTVPPASGQDDVETEKKAPVIPAAKTEVVLPAKPATPPATTGLFDVSSGEDGDDY